jgi:hypothetical protein
VLGEGVSVSYLGLYCLWCILSIRIKLEKLKKLWKCEEQRICKLSGANQILPWIALLSPLTFVYTSDMNSWVNAFAILIVAGLMFFAAWAFDYDNEMFKWVGLATITGLCLLIIFFLTNRDVFLFVFFTLFFSISLISAFYAHNKKQPIEITKIKCRDVFRKHKWKTGFGFIFTMALIAIPAIPAEEPNREYLLNFNDVTEQFIDKTITIQSVARNTTSYGRYMSANDCDALVRFNRTNAGMWEQFTVVASKSEDGYVNIRAGSNNYFVRTQHDRQHGSLIADAKYAQGWEAFRILELDGNHYLVTQTNSIFITATSVVHFCRNNVYIKGIYRPPTKKPYRKRGREV